MDILKRGWHPEKEGTTLKSQVKSLIGRGNDRSTRNPNHVPIPVSSLRDPASFAPPPKHTATRGGGNTSERSTAISPPPPLPGQAQQNQLQQDPPALRSYTVSATGLSLGHPPPPVRRELGLGRPQPPPTSRRPRLPPPGSPSTTASSTTSPPPSAAKVPPSLPPRLPPRKTASTPSISAAAAASAAAANPSPASPPILPPPPPPRSQTQTPTATSLSSAGLLNQCAVSNLASRGISVPSLGIGGDSKASGASAPSDLQNKFSKLSSWRSSSNLKQGASASGTETVAPTTTTTPPAEGTTWAQKQAALKTAANFRRDPSSVSFSDAKATASTANNFRQRHGEQVAATVQTANKLNAKYGIMDKVGKYSGTSSSASNTTPATPQDAPLSSSTTTASLTGASSTISGLVNKKRAPLPPSKKSALSSTPATTSSYSHAQVSPHGQGDKGTPPPIPLATKPQF